MRKKSTAKKNIRTNKTRTHTHTQLNSFLFFDVLKVRGF